jgi:phage protein D
MGEMNLSRLGFYTAHPTLRIDGQDSELVSGLTQSMEMREQEGGLSSLELVLVNQGLRGDGSVGPIFEDEALIKLGSEIKVYAGEAGAPTEIFKGLASAIELAMDSEGPPRLIVQAEDGAQKARLQRRTRVHERQSLADIARGLAGGMGLTPVISGLDESGAVEVQFNESDLAFLRRLLARQGGDAQVVGNELQVAPRREVQRNELELRMHSQLRKVRVVADLADQVSELTVAGFDVEQGQAIRASGSGAALGPGSGRSGAQILQQVFGARAQHSAHRLALSQAEAQALAEAEFEQRARRFVRVEGICEGNPALRVGSHLRLIDVSPRFDNRYYVTACIHRYDQRRGYETEFRAESAYLGNA